MKNEVMFHKIADGAGTAHYWRYQFGTSDLNSLMRSSKEMYVTVIREDGSEARPRCVVSNHRLTEEEMTEAFLAEEKMTEAFYKSLDETGQLVPALA